MPRQKKQKHLSDLADSAAEGKLNPDQVAVLEEEGLGPRQIIREVKQLLSADPSKLVEVDSLGSFRLKRKLLPKHMKAVVELTSSQHGGKIRFIDRVAALKLAAEMAKLVGRKEEKSAGPTQIAAPRAVFVMPGAEFPQLPAPAAPSEEN